MIELARAVPDLFRDPETGLFDHERFTRVLPVGGEEAVGQDSQIDINEALREEEAFQSWDGMDPAVLPAPMPWQHHGAHRRQHAQLLKSSGFKRWEPMNQNAFIQHFSATEIALQLQMAPFFSTRAGASVAPNTPAPQDPDEEGMPPDQGPSMHAAEVTKSPPGIRADTQNEQSKLNDEVIF